MNTHIIALFVLASIATAFPTSNDQAIGVVSMIDRRDDFGQYAYKYELNDGSVFSEQGALKKTADNKDNVLVKKGTFRYFSPEGVEVKGSYTADENGYQLMSDSVPKPLQPILPQTTPVV